MELMVLNYYNWNARDNRKAIADLCRYNQKLTNTNKGLATMLSTKPFLNVNNDAEISCIFSENKSYDILDRQVISHFQNIEYERPISQQDRVQPDFSKTVNHCFKYTFTQSFLNTPPYFKK